MSPPWDFSNFPTYSTDPERAVNFMYWTIFRFKFGQDLSKVQAGTSSLQTTADPASYCTVALPADCTVLYSNEVRCGGTRVRHLARPHGRPRLALTSPSPSKGPAQRCCEYLLGSTRMSTVRCAPAICTSTRTQNVGIIPRITVLVQHGIDVRSPFS